MNILHIGLCVDGKNEGLPFAFQEASDEYKEISTGDKNLENSILSLGNYYKFDLAFFQIQSPNIISNTIFNWLKSKGIFTINWCGDIRVGTPEWYFNTGANLTLFSNTRDIENLRLRGLKADFLQIGIDPKVYKKWTSNESGNDIVYMGNNYRNQFPEGQNRINMIQFLQSRFRNKFSLFGNGWNGSSGENNADQVKQSKIYNNSKIGINFSQFNEDRYTSDRLFRILGSGCFCLSHHYKGIEKDFETGKHLDTFKNLQELETKIHFYLENEDKRNQIAENGYNYCHNNFTYKSMVENLLKLYQKYS